MPPLPVVTDGWQLVLHQTGPSGYVGENVFGIHNADDTLTQGIADDFADAFASALGEITDFISDQFEWTGITITDLRTEGGPQFDSNSSFPVDGGAGTQPLPLQTAGMISWGTARRGRAFRGRTYICGWSEAYGNGAHMESAAHTALQAFADALLAPGLSLGVISRYVTDPGPPKVLVPRDPGIITDITSAVAHDLWKTQRRRAPRG